MWRIFITLSCISAAVLAERELLAITEPEYITINRFPKPLPDYDVDTRVRCPREFEQENENCYYISKRKVNWDTADMECRSKNATLAVLPDEYIERQFRTYVMDPRFKRVERWIGARYDPMSQSWVWGMNGEKISYNGFWKRKFKKKLDWFCAVVTPRRSFKWAPRMCHRRRQYVCHIVLDGIGQTRDSTKPKAVDVLSKDSGNQTTYDSSKLIKPFSIETNEISKQNTVHRKEVAQPTRRHPKRRYPRKSRLPISGNVLEKQSRKFSKTRWAPGTKHSDRLRLKKSKNFKEPDQWVPVSDTIPLKNKEIFPEENHEEKPLKEKYEIGPTTMVAESGNPLFELKRLPDVDLFSEEVLLKT